LAEQSFQRDSKDSIEKQYSTIILAKFPRYAEFWQKFIGGKVDPTGRFSTVPYGLSFSKSSLSTIDVKAVERDYEELAMAHYTLFCELLGAHDELENLRLTLKIADPCERLFKHFKTFENLYSHMSNAINQVCHLWALLYDMKGLQRRNRKGMFVGSQTRKNLKRTLNSHSRHLAIRLKEIENQIDCYRNNYVHFAHGICIVTESGFHVPKVPPRNPLWSNMTQTKDWNDTVIRSEKDLSNLETLINDLHEKLIYELKAFFTSKSILVKY